MAHWLIPGFLFVLGAVIGSFLNVCIIRIPQKKSIVFPSSHCPLCKKPIAFYDNIPLISYVVLNGRCRNCKAPISFQYFLVELITPLAYLTLYYYFGISWSCAISAIFLSALIVITFIDFEHQIIPDVISLPAIPFFFLSSFIVPWITPFNSLMGIAAGGGILYLIAKSYYLLRKEEGMGGGDIKLLAMIGAFLGWKGALLSLMLGACVGTIVGITMMLLRGKNIKYALPFGPFLSIGAFCALLWGNAIIRWYVNLSK
ncbi:MAG: prepilin peptidase [Proteobacteria bacterium]|nr:prepilin peptidase [Pseudomonadota bacterium]